MKHTYNVIVIFHIYQFNRYDDNSFFLFSDGIDILQKPGKPQSEVL